MRAAAAGALALLALAAAPSLAWPDAAGAMNAPTAKRVAPKAVAPLLVDGLRLTADPASGPGVLEAFDAASGKSLWTLNVYEMSYQPRLETDVQDIFITRLRRAGHHCVRVEDEAGRRWIVDLKTRRVSRG